MLTIDTSVAVKQETLESLKTHMRVTGVTENEVIANLIETKLDEYLWEQNILQTLADHREGRAKSISLEEMKARLGLEN